MGLNEVCVVVFLVGGLVHAPLDDEGLGACVKVRRTNARSSETCYALGMLAGGHADHEVIVGLDWREATSMSVWSERNRSTAARTLDSHGTDRDGIIRGTDGSGSKASNAPFRASTLRVVDVSHVGAVAGIDWCRVAARVEREEHLERMLSLLLLRESVLRGCDFVQSGKSENKSDRAEGSVGLVCMKFVSANRPERFENRAEKAGGIPSCRICTGFYVASFAQVFG